MDNYNTSAVSDIQSYYFMEASHLRKRGGGQGIHCDVNRIAKSDKDNGVRDKVPEI
jgi:hypothetical protein